MKNYYKVFKCDNRKSLDKECMKLWAEAVKLRAGNKCEFPFCRKTDYLNAHHVFSRSRNSVRYDIDNGICLCSGHHSLNYESAHKDPEFLLKILGRIDGYPAIRTESWYQTLRRKAYTPQKLDLKMEKLYLEQELKNLEKC